MCNVPTIQVIILKHPTPHVQIHVITCFNQAIFSAKMIIIVDFPSCFMKGTVKV